MITALLTGCGYNDFDGIVVPEYEEVPANVDIGYLRSLYKGEPLDIDRDMVVAGYVTANDLGSNFYRTFIVEDPTGAVEIKAGMFDLHNTFGYGRRVAIKAYGLVLGSYNGVLQIGRKSVESGYQTEYIATRYYPAGISGHRRIRARSGAVR